LVAAEIKGGLNGSAESKIDGRIRPPFEKPSKIQKGKQQHCTALPANSFPARAFIT
jgi:hypothetical protein